MTRAVELGYHNIDACGSTFVCEEHLVIATISHILRLLGRRSCPSTNQDSALCRLSSRSTSFSHRHGTLANISITRIVLNNMLTGTCLHTVLPLRATRASAYQTIEIPELYPVLDTKSEVLLVVVPYPSPISCIRSFASNRDRRRRLSCIAALPSFTRVSSFVVNFSRSYRAMRLDSTFESTSTRRPTLQASSPRA